VLIPNLIKAPAESLGENGLFVSTMYLFKPKLGIDVEIILGSDIIRRRNWVRHDQNSNRHGFLFSILPLFNTNRSRNMSQREFRRDRLGQK
jgi:hypothetical protein